MKFVSSLWNNFRNKSKLRRPVKRMYKAAKENDGWLPVNDIDVNFVIAASSPKVRARVRQLVRDFPYFKRALKKIADFRIGKGITYNPLVFNSDGLNVPLNNELKNHFDSWCERCDNTGRMHFYELQKLMVFQELEAGEYFLVKQYDKNRKPYPFFLSPIEADQLSNYKSRPINDNTVNYGIEQNKYGQIVAYHFHDGFSPKSMRVSSDYVINGLEVMRPGQLRGISPFVSSVLAANSLGEYIGAELDAAKKAAKILAIVESHDIPGHQQARRYVGEKENVNNARIEDIENAIVEYLRPNEKMNFVDSKRPTNSFSPFVKFMLQMLSIGTECPYELLSGDYEGLSFSSLRGIRMDYQLSIDCEVGRLINQALDPIQKWVFDCLYLSGHTKINYAGSNHTWRTNKQWPIQRLQDSKAAAQEMKMTAMSPQMFCADRNNDWYQVIEEISIAKKIAESKGLSLDELYGVISTADAGNDAYLTG